ncbi:MAG TPA: hypothetical protein VHM94_15545 [Acidimicrobiia bacterium]|jgi:alkylhydroperoxidase/carboxymuconolactone decarboxylase family protein YurZ|nr:hypothetical protein [Acidimicrobiia bacterium]
MSPEDEDRLRRLALNDEAMIESILSVGHEAIATSALDQRTHALVRLTSLLVVGGAPVTHYWAVENALNAGVSAAEVVGTLFAVAPIAGIARVVADVPAVALALGYDLEAALEEIR